MPLTQKQHKELVDTIRATIDERVNGKIDRMKTMLDAYIQQDEQWKHDAQPAIDNMKNLSTSWTIFLKFVLAVGGIAGAIVGVKKLFGH